MPQPDLIFTPYIPHFVEHFPSFGDFSLFL
jgi:hypothetical protein